MARFLGRAPSVGSPTAPYLIIIDGVHDTVYARAVKRRRRPTWDAVSVRGLRRHLALTQEQLAEELGVRQQTISEWETGVYRPRGASDRMLTLVAERAGFPYEAGKPKRDADG